MLFFNTMHSFNLPIHIPLVSSTSTLQQVTTYDCHHVGDLWISFQGMDVQHLWCYNGWWHGWWPLPHRHSGDGGLQGGAQRGADLSSNDAPKKARKAKPRQVSAFNRCGKEN